MDKETNHNPKRAGRCPVCGGGPIFTACDGCSAPLCRSCSLLELAGSGCGSVWPLYYCPDCASDPLINPNAMLRD